jgi:hypothetical protein
MNGGNADFAGAEICPRLYISYLAKPQNKKKTSHGGTGNTERVCFKKPKN